MINRWLLAARFRIRRFVKSLAQKPFVFARRLQQRHHSLVILDDAFPHLLTSFRIAEFNQYLETWDGAVVYSTATSFVALGETRGFKAILREYEQHFPQFSKRVFRFYSDVKFQGDLIYAVFLQNAHAMIESIEKSNIPFVLTLYPGGGFQLDQEDSDSALRRICSLPNLRTIIVTQKITRQYLIDRHSVPSERIVFIYGGVFPSDHLLSETIPHKYYRQHKECLDICFVSFKYMPLGLDKGYDVFVEVAKQLSRDHNNIQFHVVGPFDSSDIEITGFEDRISFYGVRPTSFFPAFYAGMDIILSPNVPFVLAPGAFDGFPTGSCIEAGLSGVAVFCTDPLDQNFAFRNGEELVIIAHDADKICSVITQYYSDSEALYTLARRGQEAFKRVFDIDAQMKPRIQILSKYLSTGRSEPATNIY